MKPIRVMIIEDSPTARELLLEIISSDPDLEVVAAVESGEKALKLLHEVRPEVISLDIRLPGIDGFETTRRIMSQRPTPIVVVSASVEAKDLSISMNAIRAGALSVVEKPVGMTHMDYQRVSRDICTQLKIMSEVKVVRQWSKEATQIDAFERRPVPAKGGGIPSTGTGGYKIVGIATSTGGPNALYEILKMFPKTFPLPILVVQHIAHNFLNGFIAWLESISPLPVVMITARTQPEPGVVYLPKADSHLVVDRGYICPDHGPPVHYQRPSGTILFKSMASWYGRQALGIILTGMGEDGADGIKAVRNAGGYTIAQDRQTSVVYGMPGAAVEMGAVCESLPLNEISVRILNLLKRSR